MMRVWVTLALGLLASCLPQLSAAQAYPNRPVKIVVPFAAGSGSDIVGRLLAEELRKRFDQSFVIDNKPGGSAQIAAEMVAKAPPDGYTLLLTTNTAHSANPFLFKSLRYDPVRDFTPIARITYIPYVLVVRPDSGIASTGALVQKMRASPGKLNYGYGNSTSQVAGAAFVQMAAVDVTAVPFKSMPPVLGRAHRRTPRFRLRGPHVGARSRQGGTTQADRIHPYQAVVADAGPADGRGDARICRL